MDLPVVVNIVSSAKLTERPANLASIDLPNKKYIPERFPALISRNPDLGGTVMLYPNGSITTSGAKTMKQTDDLIKLVESVCGSTAENFKVNNIVARLDAGVRPDLERMANENASVSYEPEIICAAIFKVTPATVMVFYTGNGIVTGCKTFDQLKTCYQETLDFLYGYKR